MSTTVLIVEDEEAIRSNIALLLKFEGYTVQMASDGRAGLAQLQLQRPDVLISDVNMPHMNGFELLAAVRADAALATLPVLLLTALDDRANMRRGMAGGADDYLSKPFTRDELLQAISSLVDKKARQTELLKSSIQQAVQDALAAQEAQLQDKYARLMDEATSREQAADQSKTVSLPIAGAAAAAGAAQMTAPLHSHLAEPASALDGDRNLRAVVLFLGIREFTAWAERLSSAEIADVLKDYFLHCCQPLLAYGGQHLRFVGDGLLAVFPLPTESTQTAQLNSQAAPQAADAAPADYAAAPADFEAAPADYAAAPARRALASALALAEVTQVFKRILQTRFAQRALPEFALGVGLHVGRLSAQRIRTLPALASANVDDPLHLAAELQAASGELGWGIAASLEVMGLAGPGVQTAGYAQLKVSGHELPLDACAIQSLDQLPACEPELSAEASLQLAELQRALEANAQITARAVKSALQSRLSALQRHVFDSNAPPLKLRGYRVLRKVGAGGVADIYLAMRESDSLAVVLKVLNMQTTQGGLHLERFIREFTLLAKINHPNVMKIYDQGFTDDHAYMTMEYFERGDLRANFDFVEGVPRALLIARQVARALVAIHQQGIVHRDLKPDNLMLRADDSVVLGDFGIAKPLEDDGLDWNQTRQGEAVGTPNYVSPEQAAGKDLTPQSDLYSLGVMLFEMLAGYRPFHAESLTSLMQSHRHAPVPRLPQDSSQLQPIVDKLMAKDLQQRYASAQAVLDDLDALVLPV
jgi:serine/threonine-protein kinase PpkA